MDNEELIENARQAVQDLFGDISVPVSVTRENLQCLIGEIQDMLSSLPDEE